MQRISLRIAIMVLTFLIGAVTVSSWATHQSNLASKKHLSTTKVLEITGKLHEALVNKDIESLKRLTPNDFTWTMIDDIPINKSQWLNMLEDGGFRYKAIDVDNVETTINGDMATVTGRGINLVTTFEDRFRSSFESDYSFTYRFEMRHGHWEIISASFDYWK